MKPAMTRPEPAARLQARSGVWGSLAWRLHGWLDRLAAARYCSRLCRQFTRQRGLHTGPGGEALYAEVVQRDLGVGPAHAQEIVSRAAESYTAWPAVRPVKFRDVVHYLVAMRILEHQGRVDGEIAALVQARVPAAW